MILERFDIFNARQQQGQAPEPEESKDEGAAPQVPITNGYHAPSPKSPTPAKSSPAKRDAPAEPISDAIEESPPKKKRKEPSVDADAAYAARLQAEEDKRARPTRGGGSKKSAPVKKKTPKKKTAARIRGSDESDANDSSTDKKPNNTGFNVRRHAHHTSRQPDMMIETDESLASIIRTPERRNCSKFYDHQIW